MFSVTAGGYLEVPVQPGARSGKALGSCVRPEIAVCERVDGKWLGGRHQISETARNRRGGDILALACAYPRHFCLGYLADWAGLKETGLREAQVTSLSNDNVVMNRNVEQFTASHQLLGDDAIVGRRSGIAGGMVVGENYGGRTRNYCSTEDLAGMDNGRVEDCELCVFLP